MDWFDPFASGADASQALAETFRRAGVPLPGGAGQLVLDLGADELSCAGAECARTDFERVVGGLRLMMRALGAERAVFAAGEVFFPLFRSLRRLLPRGGNISCLRYDPDPGETNLACLRRHLGAIRPVPAQLCRAAFAAYYEDERWTERLFCVSGAGLPEPLVFRLSFGASAAEALARCGERTAAPRRVIAGTLLSGTALTDLDAPLPDAVDTLILRAARDCFERENWKCIRCGRCLRVCPQGLEPGRLALGKAAALEGCTDCGACTYFCPARVPLNALIAAQRAAAAKEASV